MQVDYTILPEFIRRTSLAGSDFALCLQATYGVMACETEYSVA